MATNVQRSHTEEVMLHATVNGELSVADTAILYLDSDTGKVRVSENGGAFTDVIIMTAADKTKLDGVATGATANATDAQLRDRSTHTGSQAQSTITNLVSDLAGKQTTLGFTPENAASKNAANGYAGLSASSKIMASQMSAVLTSSDLTNDSALEKIANKNAASGYAGLSAGSKITASQMSGVLASSDLTNDAALEKTANKAAASGYASLDAGTKIPIAQIPTGATSSTVTIGNDSRLSDSRAPNGNAGGDLAGTYPNPTVKASVALTTPSIGAATGTSLAATGAITSSGGGVGYATGAGGTVSQSGNKSTGVTLNKLCGTITMAASALAAATIVTFTVTNNQVAATDVIVAQHDSVGTTGAYTIAPNTSAAGSFKISVRNNTGGSLSEAIMIRFAVIKAVAA